ncbi:MAG TPA: hypothetical protein VGG58_11125 [Candidatus Acidoferrum sp.]
MPREEEHEQANVERLRLRRFSWIMALHHGEGNPAVRNRCKKKQAFSTPSQRLRFTRHPTLSVPALETGAI